MGTRIYGDEWQGNSLLDNALALMRYDSDIFIGIDDEDLENACRKFASSSTAMLYVASLKRLRDKAAKRFGGTENEEAQAWLEEESHFMELRYHEREKKKLEERK